MQFNLFTMSLPQKPLDQGFHPLHKKPLNVPIHSIVSVFESNSAVWQWMWNRVSSAGIQTIVWVFSHNHWTRAPAHFSFSFYSTIHCVSFWSLSKGIENTSHRQTDRKLILLSVSFFLFLLPFLFHPTSNKKWRQKSLAGKECFYLFSLIPQPPSFSVWLFFCVQYGMTSVTRFGKILQLWQNYKVFGNFLRVS